MRAYPVGQRVGSVRNLALLDPLVLIGPVPAHDASQVADHPVLASNCGGQGAKQVLFRLGSGPKSREAIPADPAGRQNKLHADEGECHSNSY